MPSENVQLDAPQSNRDKFFNRELSWLKFNHRVLEEVIGDSEELLEKIKFVDIFCRNLDEFFMVRVAGLRRAMIESLASTDSPDQAPPAEIKRQVNRYTQKSLNELYEATFQNLLPKLEHLNIKVLKYQSLDESSLVQMSEYFQRSVFPVLTPLAVDPAHPFPFLSNLRQYLLIVFSSEVTYVQELPIAFVEIPDVLPRLIPLKSNDENTFHFVLLEDLITHHLNSLFLGYQIQEIGRIRVTRDLDFTLLENDVVDLLKSVQKGVRSREQAGAVRLEYANVSGRILALLKAQLELTDDDVYGFDGPLNLSGFSSLYDLPIPHAKAKTFNPRLPNQMKSNKDMFTIVREGDLLLHHPYESFYAVIEFLNHAANDPKVLAIKQTLYRTSGDSPVIDALIRAAENGKHVTAVVELKARFDEHNNISWARQMERAGVNVVFGFIGLKTHGKATLIVREEGAELKRYVHLSTGNYNSSTAKSYVDLSLITANPEIGHDISAFFNLLTGFNIFNQTSSRSKLVLPNFKRITIAPLNLREKIISLIEEEIGFQKAQGGARIIGKMNAIVDPEIIEKLYEASNAGVKIDLIVRGICCLRPGVKGLSENIRVISLVDRFLEHSRIYYFNSGGKENIYLASADLMTRNMDRRVEVLFPILDKSCHSRIKNEILETYLGDNTKARELGSDGDYFPIATPIANLGKKEFRAQTHFIGLARESGLKSIPYEIAIHVNRRKDAGRPLFGKNTPKVIENLKGVKP